MACLQGQVASLCAISLPQTRKTMRIFSVLIEWTVSSPGICDAIVRLLEAANRRTVHEGR